MGFARNFKQNHRTDNIKINEFMALVYSGMAGGLFLTAVTAFFVMNSGILFSLMIANKYIYFGLLLLELVIVFGITLMIEKISYKTAAIALIFYSILNGITLTPIFYVYTSGSIVAAFFTTSAMFLGMTFLGYTIKKDLGYLGKFFLMALIGFIAALIINFFLKSTLIDFFISVAGVLLFAGLTVYDTQRIRKAARYTKDKKYALVSSLSLYLNFINIFLNLLRLMGRRT